MIVTLANEQIELLPEKAFFWKKENLLGFSDVHLGKAESLQTYGIPIPSGNHTDEFKRISTLIEKTKAQRIIILGDLIHQKNSWTEQLTKDLENFFLSHKNLDWNLLIGNHERGSLQTLQNLPITLIENNLTLSPFLMTHGHTTQKEQKNRFQIQGHIHPVIKLQEGSTRLRLPCFVITENSLTLPSFGQMTGGYEIHPKTKQRILAITPSSVFEV